MDNKNEAKKTEDRDNLDDILAQAKAGVGIIQILSREMEGPVEAMKLLSGLLVSFANALKVPKDFLLRAVGADFDNVERHLGKLAAVPTAPLASGPVGLA
jgi:hypothetical protein